MTPPRTPILVTLAALLLLAGCSTLRPTRDGKPDAGGIEGVVVGSTGAGVRGATVAVLTADTPPRQLGSATTDAAGRFLVERLEPGPDRVVRVTKPTRAVTLQARKEAVPVTGGRVRDVGALELKAFGG